MSASRAPDALLTDGAPAALRVIFLSATATIGGAERALLDLVAGLQTVAGPELSLGAIVAGDGPLVAALAALGIPVRIVEMPPAIATLGDYGIRSWGGRARVAGRLLLALPHVMRFFGRLRRAVRELRADVIHSNGLKTHLLSAFLPRRAGRLVWHLHDFTGTRAIMARVLPRLAGRADAVIANSAAVADDWRTLTGTRADVVLNGIDLGRFTATAANVDLDALAGLETAREPIVRFGLIATMAAWKGHDVFLRALAMLPRELPWRGYVIGGALYRTAGSQASIDDLRALAVRIGIADRVGFTGHVSDVPSVMRALDVVVHASRLPEPFGLVIAEAMASGRATVVSNAGGARELFTPELDALGVPPGDADALSSTLERLLRDADLRQRLGASARETASRRFSRDRYALDVLTIYRRVTQDQRLTFARRAGVGSAGDG